MRVTMQSIRTHWKAKHGIDLPSEIKYWVADPTRHGPHPKILSALLCVVTVGQSSIRWLGPVADKAVPCAPVWLRLCLA